jgi:hypothetical protein
MTCSGKFVEPMVIVVELADDWASLRVDAEAAEVAVREAAVPTRARAAAASRVVGRGMWAS